MTVLIVGSEAFDPHIHAVQRHLETAGVKAAVFDPWPDEHRCLLSLNINNKEKDFTLSSETYCYSAQDITAIWWRAKGFFGEKIHRLNQVDKHFVQNEWLVMFDFIGLSFDHIQWLNPRLLSKKWQLKPLQLDLARKIGFMIPDTLFTHDPEKAIAFFDKHDEIICKAVSRYSDEGNGEEEIKVVYTNKITKDDLLTKKENIKVAPSTFQRMIPKSYELRVTVVGDRLFTVKLDSQSAENGKVDWRRATEQVPHEPYVLDRDLHDKIMTYHAATGLIYGAYDLIVSEPNGDVYFLEVNPAGQWLWIENMTGLPISAAVADTLGELSRKQ